MNVLCVCTAGKDRSPAMTKWLMENYPDVDAKAAGISVHRTGYYDTTHVTDWIDFLENKTDHPIMFDSDLCITVGPIHYGYLRALFDSSIFWETPIVVIEALRKARPEQVPEIMEAHRKRIEKAMNKVRNKTNG